jgi:hypothetical protein
MLESLFNTARCKVIQGEIDGAINDLETLVLKERNYCIKVFTDDDFSGINEQFSNLIMKLKKAVFVNAKEKFDQLQTLLSELTSIGGTIQENIPSTFSEELPYFDIFDYEVKFRGIIPILQTAIEERKRILEKEKQEKMKKEAMVNQIKSDIAKIKQISQRDDWGENSVDRKFVDSKRDEYYTNKINHYIRKQDVDMLIDEEGRESYPLGNEKISPVFTLQHILSLSAPDFVDYVDNLYTEDSNKKIVLNQVTTIKRFKVLRENKELANQLIEVIETAFEKYHKYNKKTYEKKERREVILGLTVIGIVIAIIVALIIKCVA